MTRKRSISFPRRATSSSVRALDAAGRLPQELAPRVASRLAKCGGCARSGFISCLCPRIPRVHSNNAVPAPARRPERLLRRDARLRRTLVGDGRFSRRGAVSEAPSGADAGARAEGGGDRSSTPIVRGGHAFALRDPSRQGEDDDGPHRDRSADRTGEQSPWVLKARQARDAIGQATRDEKTPWAKLPYTKEQLQAASDRLAAGSRTLERGGDVAWRRISRVFRGLRGASETPPDCHDKYLKSLTEFRVMRGYKTIAVSGVERYELCLTPPEPGATRARFSSVPAQNSPTSQTAGRRKGGCASFDLSYIRGLSRREQCGAPAAGNADLSSLFYFFVWAPEISSSPLLVFVAHAGAPLPTSVASRFPPLFRGRRDRCVASLA